MSKKNNTAKLCKCFEKIEKPYYPSEFMKGFFAAKGIKIPTTTVCCICNGTRERDECDCDGDVKKCTFYPENRK